MSDEKMSVADEHKRTHLDGLSSDDGTPFLAMFAEVADQRALAGGYDHRAEVWVANGQPVAMGVPVVMETMTYTNVGGESQDSD